MTTSFSKRPSPNVLHGKANEGENYAFWGFQWGMNYSDTMLIHVSLQSATIVKSTVTSDLFWQTSPAKPSLCQDAKTLVVKHRSFLAARVKTVPRCLTELPGQHTLLREEDLNLSGHCLPVLFFAAFVRSPPLFPMVQRPQKDESFRFGKGKNTHTWG